MMVKGDKKALEVFRAVAGLTEADEALLVPHLYTPHGVAELIAQMDPLVKLKRAGRLSKKKVQPLGYMLEDLALLIFQSLAGLDTFLSYQSIDAQLDLVVSGPDLLWREITKMLHIDEYSSILVEAKAWTDKVGVTEFLRLGSLLSHHCRKTSGLGVLFTLEGASGFPAPGDTRHSLRDARATQTILYHSIKKPIVVFDWEDIKTLDKAGSLVTMMRRKVQEIEAMTGVPTALPDEPVQVLPDRLKKLLRKDLGGDRPV
jgi:hypothetical protein